MGKAFKKTPKSSAPTPKPKGGKKRFSIDHDTFFDNDKKRRRNFEDDNIESSDEDDYGELRAGEEAEQEEEVETAAEVRKRIAEAHLEKLRRIKDEEDKGDEGSDEDEGRDREGERDTWIANVLQQEQLEDSGRVRRLIASR